MAILDCRPEILMEVSEKVLFVTLNLFQGLKNHRFYEMLKQVQHDNGRLFLLFQNPVKLLLTSLNFRLKFGIRKICILSNQLNKVRNYNALQMVCNA